MVMSMMNLLVKVFSEILYLGAMSSIIIVLILALKRLFGKIMSPKWHYYIWMLLVIRLLVPVFPESSFSALNLYYFTAEQLHIRSEGTLPSLNPSRNTGSEDSSLQETVKNTPSTDNLPDKPSDSTDNLNPSGNNLAKHIGVMEVLAIIWLSGMSLLLLYTIYINVLFYLKMKRTYTPSNNERILSILVECKQIVGINKEISLYTTNRPRTPSLYSLFHTRILVSEVYFEQLSDQEIKYIFLHELSHYKRKDITLNWILTVLQIVYFFQPLVWYAFAKLHEDCEISCDSEALRYLKSEEYQNYGITVIKLIKLFSESNFIPVTAGLWKHKSNYKRRIIMITKYKKQRWINTLITLILIIIVGLVGLTGCKKVGTYTGNNDTPSVTEEVKNVQVTEIPAPTASVTKAPTKENGSNSGDTTKPEVTKTPSKNTQSNDKNTDIFYGNWSISKVIAYGSAGTYSKEDAEGLIGKNLIFSKDSATCFGDDPAYLKKSIQNPSYKRTSVSASDFITNYNMTFEKLGISKDSVNMIEVSDSANNVYTFLVKDDNTLIVIGGGTYFELVRKH